jgi:hypothetical protein
MRRCTILYFIAVALSAQPTASPTGKWISNLKFFDDENYDRLELVLDGTKLTGKLGNDIFEGTYQNGRIEGEVKPRPTQTIKLEGALNGDRITGTALVVEPKVELKWVAIVNRPEAPSRPRRIRSSQPGLNIIFQTPSSRCFISVLETQ